MQCRASFSRAADRLTSGSVPILGSRGPRTRSQGQHTHLHKSVSLFRLKFSSHRAAARPSSLQWARSTNASFQTTGFESMIWKSI
jgi:hypothetical protein